jgi:hypothetical protein
MAIFTWEPDTCNCKLVIEHFDNGVENGTVLANSTICNFHTGKTRANILPSALDHGRRKNHIIGEVLSRFPAIAGKLDENGSLVLKDDKTVNWSFSGTGDSRVLNISFVGITLSNAQKNTLQNAVNTRFGAGKIVIS